MQLPVTAATAARCALFVVVPAVRAMRPRYRIALGADRNADPVPTSVATGA